MEEPPFYEEEPEDLYEQEEPPEEQEAPPPVPSTPGPDSLPDAELGGFARADPSAANGRGGCRDCRCLSVDQRWLAAFGVYLYVPRPPAAAPPQHPSKRSIDMCCDITW